MHFVVIGAGALGSIYAGFLARAGHRVSLIARGQRAADLERQGVRITGLDDFDVTCDIVTEPESLTEADVVINAVKTYDSRAALSRLTHLKVHSAFSVQNGVLKNRLLADTFGSEAVLGAVGMLGGAVLPGEPGPVRYNMPGPTVIGEPTGIPSERVPQIVGALKEAGLNASESDDITSVEWSKFVGWSGVSALAVLTRLETWRFLVDSHGALLAARVIRETASVAGALGIELQDSGNTSRAFLSATEADAVAMLQENGQRMSQTSPDFRQSMLQDVDRGRQLEVEETIAHTVSEARRLGVSVPTVEFCTHLMRTVSHANQSP